MNRVELVGRLTKDPEIRQSGEGMTSARFSIAINRAFKDKTTGEYGVDYPNCVAFGKTAEFMGKYFKKGMPIGVTGRLQTGSYVNKDGKTVYTTDVVADGVEFVGSKSENGSGTANTVQNANPAYSNNTYANNARTVSAYNPNAYNAQGYNAAPYGDPNLVETPYYHTNDNVDDDALPFN